MQGPRPGIMIPGLAWAIGRRPRPQLGGCQTASHGDCAGPLQRNSSCDYGPAAAAAAPAGSPVVTDRQVASDSVSFMLDDSERRTLARDPALQAQYMVGTGRKARPGRAGKSRARCRAYSGLPWVGSSIS